MPNKTQTTTKTHKLRTFFAAIVGAVAVYLILSSVTVIWLNQTLTSTPTYVGTVAPLVTKPAIQDFIAQNVTNQLLNNAPVQNFATSLLPASELNGNPTTAQLKNLLNPIIQTDVLRIVQSPSFATLWRNTNQTAHAELISQLNNNSNQITLDLSPAVNGVVSELKASKLSAVANNVNISPNTGKLDIKSNSISQAHRYYKLFKEGTIAIVVITLLAIGLSVWLSVHHAKTARRILLITGVLAIFQALVLEAPRLVKLSGTNQVDQNAAKAFVEAFFHNLQISSLILGVVCVLAAIIWKVLAKKNKQTVKPRT